MIPHILTDAFRIDETITAPATDAGPAGPAGPAAFRRHLMGMKQALADMSPDQALISVVGNVDDLIELYLNISHLQHEFHRACEEGTLPRPVAGNA
jgi:hypothetical protein